jgi:hypothetical protein
MSKYSQYESPGTTYIGHTYMRKYVMDNLGILYLGLAKCVGFILSYVLRVWSSA